MAIQIQGNSGVTGDIDEARNLLTSDIQAAGYPSAGGFYSVTGFTTTAVAASLATTTTLMSFRLSTGSTRKAYIHRIRVMMSVATAGAAGGVPTVLGLQRFTAATPSGGTARTPDRHSGTKGSATDVTDVRDSNAALTVTSVTFGNVIASTLVPNGSTNVAPAEWVIEAAQATPIEFVAGDGVCLRTQNAGPATATWNFQYNVYWYER